MLGGTDSSQVQMKMEVSQSFTTIKVNAGMNRQQLDSKKDGATIIIPHNKDHCWKERTAARFK
jgi:hypothetical protein